MLTLLRLLHSIYSSYIFLLLLHFFQIFWKYSKEKVSAIVWLLISTCVTCIYFWLMYESAYCQRISIRWNFPRLLLALTYIFRKIEIMTTAKTWRVKIQKATLPFSSIHFGFFRYIFFLTEFKCSPSERQRKKNKSDPLLCMSYQWWGNEGKNGTHNSFSHKNNVTSIIIIIIVNTPRVRIFHLFFHSHCSHRSETIDKLNRKKRNKRNFL